MFSLKHFEKGISEAKLHNYFGNSSSGKTDSALAHPQRIDVKEYDFLL